MKLPVNGVWKSAQNGERFGDIVRSRSIDLSKDGVVKLARKSMCIFGYGVTTDNSANTDPAFQGTVLGMVTDTQYAYVVTASSVFRGDITDKLFTLLEAQASNKPTIGFDSDIVMWQGKPFVSGGQYISDLNLGISTWGGRRITGLSTTVPHPLCVLEQLNQLAVGNGNTVKTYDTSYSLQNTLTLPSEYIVTGIRWRQNNLYIATRHQYGGEAKLFIWNGSGSSAQYGYGCGADWIYSLCEYGGSMVICTSAGQIRRFNGGGFDDLVNFPVYYTPYSWASANGAGYIVGKVANRGMMADGNFLYINIDGTLNNAAGVETGTYLPSQPSGLWCYSKTSGLWHQGSLNFTPRLRQTPTALNSSYLSFGTAHQATTGDPILCGSVSGLTGLNTGQVYYAIVGSTTTMRLALSPSDAEAGRYVQIGGTISTDAFIMARYETLGYGTASYPGFVFTFGAARPSTFYATDVFFGGGLYDSSASLYKAALCGLSMAPNRGYFVTGRIPAERLTDTFSSLAFFFDQLRLSTDSILVKYRTKPRLGLPSPLAFSGNGATFTSATTFTVDTTLKDVKSLQVGDEIEIITSQAAGYTAHITAIESSTSTYTFTVDETMPVSSGTFDFIADNWSKGPTITRDSLLNLKTGAQVSLPNVNGGYLELKIEMRGQTPAVEAVDVIQSIQT